MIKEMIFHKITKETDISNLKEENLKYVYSDDEGCGCMYFKTLTGFEAYSFKEYEVSEKLYTQFPELRKSLHIVWNNNKDKYTGYNGKYVCIYAGHGALLRIDKSIYDTYVNYYSKQKNLKDYYGFVDAYETFENMCIDIINANCEKALNKFIDQYKDEDYFLGAILTGSYATGNNTPNSDIDVFIVTKDSTTWRERGNKLIDGYLIEYFINPVRQVLKEFEEGFINNGIATTRIFVGSKILYDKEGTIEKLINIAKENINREIGPLAEFKKKMNNYTIWHSFYELTSKYERKEDIDFTYNIFLNNIIESYFLNKQIPLLPIHKIEKMLINEEYRKRYNVNKLPEDEFVNKLLNCFNEKDYNKRYEYAKELYNYYMEQNNDFDINDFSLRSEI